jgi:hypothetical protein
VEVGIRRKSNQKRGRQGLAEVEEVRGQAGRGTRDGCSPECVHQGESGGRPGY